MATKLVQDSSLTSIANAIRTKGGTSAPLEFPTDFVSAIENIPTGGGSLVAPNDVTFYDYDGTVTNSYTASEFAALTAMPANPTHTRLTAQGWNWSLADAKAYVAKYGKLNIGQMYVTTSGDTEIDIRLAPGRNKPCLGCCPNGTVEIDWGDGSAHDTLTGTSTTSFKYIQHIYPDTGAMFTIKLHMDSGELAFLGTSTSSAGSYVVWSGAESSSYGQRAYQNAVKEVRCGSHVVGIGAYAFSQCYSLASVMIPDSVTSISNYAFSNCYSLASVTIPNGVMNIDNHAFQNCYSLASVTIPDSVTSIGNNVFNNCYTLISVTIPDTVTSISESTCNGCRSLASVTIPENVTSIGNTAFSNCNSLTSVTISDTVMSIGNNGFYNCSSLAQLIFEPTTPPTAGTSVFNNVSSDLVVYVPAGTLTAYQSASNYSRITSQMVEMAA